MIRLDIYFNTIGPRVLISEIYILLWISSDKKAFFISSPAFLAIVSPWSEVLNGGNVQWIMFSLNLAWGAIALLSMNLLAGFGVLGLVLARLIAFVVKASLTIVFANKMIRRMSRVGFNKDFG